MSLKKYKEKRKFDDTPEPEGKVSRNSGVLKFVVQKHHASRLHYDFRLEMEGVLKSWAVPKGPSVNPEDKRLAMMVEDHPMDYRQFEGIIPEGNYGAGTVMVWDEGTYYLTDQKDPKKAGKELLKGLHAGKISFILEGTKLRGEFTLVKLHGREENAWLLIKVKDKFASSKDITLLDYSAVSNRTLEEIKREAEQKGDVWHSNRADKKEPGFLQKIRKFIIDPKAKLPSDLRDAKKSRMPSNIKPMLATLVDDPFDSDEWIFEIKWDGYRAIAEIDEGHVKLYSRNLLPFNQKFKAIAEELKRIPGKAVLDGEIVVLDDEGISQFQLLQNYQRSGKGNIVFYAFDILYYEGYDLQDLPLLKRKEILRQMLPPLERIRLSDHIEKAGKAMFSASEKQNLEGIIAKKADSIYRQDARSRNWLKIKTVKQQEAIICGFTEGRGGRKHFGALVLGVYNRGKLEYIGHTGGGFNDKMLNEMIGKLEPLKTEESPFAKPPKTNMPVTWVEPRLVCEVKLSGWTSDGSMRHPVFIGLREDKSPEEVQKEKPAHTEDIRIDLPHKERYSSRGKKKNSPVSSKLPGKKIDTGKSISMDQGKKDKEIRLEGHILKLTNLDKLYWKKEKITKLDLINYYLKMAPLILPYLHDRPESLHRHPNGIHGESFFQKDVKDMPPEWVETVEIYSESNGKDINYLLCQDTATLVYLANLGCIELNPWHSRNETLKYPDYIIIDLDPLEVSFKKVIEAALVTRDVLGEAGIPCYCKTSGSTGLHIYIPMGARYNYDQAKQFAEIIATIVQQKLPKTTSIERMPAKRKRKVYLDYLQNRTGQTIAAPYCVRPKPGATVSTPLEWKNVAEIEPGDFTIHTIFDYIQKKGDLFTSILGEGVALEESLGQLQQNLRARMINSSV